MGLELPPNYRPSDDEPFMNERQREYFRRRLVQWKDDIIRESKETLQNLAADSIAHADLADRASSEAERANELRARDRQRKLISKSTRRFGGSKRGPTGFAKRRATRSRCAGWKRVPSRP
jgi:DnaK suppressor protein